MAARKRESEGRNSDPGRLDDRFMLGRAHAPKTPIFIRFSAKCPKPAEKLQKQQYLQGFLQKSLKNIKKTQVSAVFTRFSAKSVQKHNYLQGFR